MSNPSWQDAVQQVQNHRANTIAEVRPRIPDVPKNLPLNVTSIPRKLLSSREIEITESTTEVLVAALATGKLTSREVTIAFLRRAGLAQSLASETSSHLFSIAADNTKGQLRHGASPSTSSRAC